MNRKELFTEKAEEIFCTALERTDPVARSAFLTEACAEDPELRKKVEALLAAQDEAANLFAASTAAMHVTAAVRQTIIADSAVRESVGLRANPDEALGTKIGPYRLIEVLGQGGCGIVYLAEQEKPVRRQVALKIIKLGLDTQSVIARFDAERQALAMMDHPNIAHVLDAGATEGGRPYFVMELVRGVKITAFCDQQRLALADRLKLFIQVCFAIQHAHQKGIIHRDIKPSNILVTVHDDLPRPMVIDFGIAKAVEGRLTDATTFTSSEIFIGTPAYMSPEQAQRSRLDVDTRSDIYSLGVLIYELATGRTPFDTAKLVDAGIEEIRRILREEEPKRPSAMLGTMGDDARETVAQNRQTGPGELVANVRGDLDWIAIRALEKDRNRRYQTANDLAVDVQRYLNNEIVAARPPTKVYRLQKLWRRHRAIFVAAAAAALVLAAGLVTTTVLLLRERDLRKEQARLRTAAEHGLAVEAELRRQAEWREGIRQVTALVYANALADADKLAAELPRDPATLEGSDMLRTLGEWNALRGEWATAQLRYQSLLRANRFETVDRASLDLLAAAVAIVKSTDEGAYDAFCRQTVISSRGTGDPIIIDRVLKSCLLTPLSDEYVVDLQRLAGIAKLHLQSRPTAGVGPDLLWRCQTLALWEYRNRRYEDSIALCDRVLGAGNRPVCRSTSVMVIRALALFQLNQKEKARAELDEARRTILAKMPRPLIAYHTGEGFWFDWMICEILADEASALIGTPTPVPR